MSARTSGERRTVALATVGCKLNQYETEGIAELFEREGLTVIPFDEQADVYVVNTCTVTMRSDYRSRQMLRRAARRNPQALIVGTGCYVQRDPEGVARLPEVDVLVGNSAKTRLAGIVLEHLRGKRTVRAPACGPRNTPAAYGVSWEPDATHPPRPRIVVEPIVDRSFDALDIARFRGHTRAFIKIQDGCDRRCSYCAVPDARGPARSRPHDDVLRQARRLAANGYREIVLTGVHVAGYGSERGGPRLHELLCELSEVDGLDRIRLGSVEPNELVPELARAVLSLGRVCNHIHVPLQSGSDRILARMRRGYTAAEYAARVRSITDHDGACGLGADVMVGFPGETEEDFADTLSLVTTLPFTYLHVFSYSPRRNTPAASMPDSVPADEKKRRSVILRTLGKTKSLAFRLGLAGKRLEVLIEGFGRSAGESLSGLSTNYVRVDLTGEPSLRNKLVQVEVLGADRLRTWGAPLPGTAR